MKLFENEFYRISLDTVTPCLEWIGKKFMPSDQFRESELKSLDFFIQYKSKHAKLEWYVDARDIGPISPADTKWVAEEILPEFSKAGLSKEVFVVPGSALGKMVVNNYVSRSGHTIEMNVFDTEVEAKKWLKG